MAAMQSVSLTSIPNLEFKRILVTTDFSDCSLAALKQAAAIARLHGSELLMLHVVSPEPMIQQSLEPPTWEYQDIIHQAETQMKTAETDEVLAGIPHRFIVENGALEPVLSQMIKEREISLLVVGTHGRTGIKKLLLGSVAEEIFRRAECPVMTIGPSESPALLAHGRFLSVLFATDFSPASMRALPYAIAFARESQARLTLMHVVNEGSVTALYLNERLVAYARRQLEQLLPALSISSPEIEVVTGYPVEEILRVADMKRADLIVIGVHKAGGFGARTSAHLPWTIAQSVACYAKSPVLTVRG